MGSKRSFLMLACVCFFIVMCVFADGNRKLSMRVFPCPPSSCSQNSSIIHVEAISEDNSSTIHYLWTTFPIPTIVIAYTTLKDVKLLIDWEKLINSSSHSLGLKFDDTVNYTVGFTLPRIYEYDDDDDNVDLNDNSFMVVHEFLESTKWEMDLDESASQVKFTANDSIILKFIASDSDGRESQLPHLKHTANSNRFSLTLDHMNVTTNKTRFAVEVNYIVQARYKPDVSSEKSIDDEYTPAVFETVYGKIAGKHGKAYSQWKPIAYTKAELGRKFQTKASASGVEKVVNRSWNIAEVAMNESYGVYGLNVSFGLTKDGFYQKNKYLTWSGIVGYGDPATESLSLLVILIIFIGVGLPLAIILFGGTYVQVRKRCVKSNRNVNTSYGRIN